MKNKLFGFFFCLLLLTSGVFSQVEGDFHYEPYSNEVKLTHYSGHANHVEIPSMLGGKRVVRISGGAFWNNKTMTSVTIPNTVISLGDDAFYGTGLTTVTIPASVTIIEEDVFSECFNLTEIKVDKNNSKYLAMDGVLFNKAMTDLYSYPSGKTTENYSIPASVIRIFDDSFVGAQFLKTVFIPRSVREMTAWEDDEVPGNFINCPKLSAINVDANNQYFSSVDGVLFDKNKTKLVAYPSGRDRNEYTIPSTVKTIMNDSFTAEGVLQVLNVPGSVTAIEAYAMELCTSLQRIIFAGRPPTLKPDEDGGYGWYFPNVWGWGGGMTVICAYPGMGWENLDTFGDLPVEIIAQLAALHIDGYGEIIANNQSPYWAWAEFTDGDWAEVNPIWSITSGGLYATVDADGIVTAKNVTAQQTITLKASYTEGGVTKTDSINITIMPVTLVQLYITGVDVVTSGEQTTYTATAIFSDGGEKVVTPTWSISNGAEYATVNANGILTATDELYQQKYVILSASYTQDGITETADKQITIKAKQPKLTGIELVAETKTVLAGKTVRLEARALYNVGEDKKVNPTWSIIKGADISYIANSTVTVSSEINEPEIITIQARYSENGIVVTNRIDLAVMPIVYPDDIFEYTYIFNPGWQLVSIVLDLTDDSERGLLRNFSIFSFDSTANYYLIPQELKAGMSYWLFTQEKTNFIVQGTPLGRKLP
ncbi:MAG: leucine-rich repeat domain-containing protein [Lentisphaerae bacterium]|nr:leucine-rich repeat domain-containing protein [Lentisphaerota bacterium]HQL87308.1 leucine-rich repeat protein [Lentisphaeria bacterium]